MSRLPIRVRLAIAFALAMAALIAVSGWFLYVRLGADLSAALDLGLRQRQEDLAALVREPSVVPNLDGPGLIERGELFAQVLGSDGRVLQSTSMLGDRPLLTAREFTRARQGTIFADRSSVPGLDEPARLLASPVTRGDEQVVLVVGGTKQNAYETLTKLRTEMLIGGPLTLLATALGGYLLAGAALRPVEAMRRRAAVITANEPGRRLPLPAADDELSRLGITLNDLLSRLEAAVAPGSATSSPTPATSCVPRWPCSRPSWSWRCGTPGRRVSCAPRSPRRQRRPTISPSSPSACC